MITFTLPSSSRCYIFILTPFLPQLLLPLPPSFVLLLSPEVDGSVRSRPYLPPLFAPVYIIDRWGCFSSTIHQHPHLHLLLPVLRLLAHITLKHRPRWEIGTRCGGGGGGELAEHARMCERFMLEGESVWVSSLLQVCVADIKCLWDAENMHSLHMWVYRAVISQKTKYESFNLKSTHRTADVQNPLLEK